MDNGRLQLLLLMWVAAAAALAVGRWWRKTPGTGLVLAYVLNLWVIHWVAPALYLLPWYQNFDQRIVEAGLEQSVYSAVAFAFGSLALTPFLLSFGILPRARAQLEVDTRLPKAYIALGAGSYAVMSMGVGALPSATAVFATGQQLVVVGLALCCWHAWRTRSNGKLVLWLGVTLLLPFVTIVTRGFIGYGAVATLTVIIFISGFLKPRSAVLAAGILLGYLGLSVFVTYMRDRNEIRDTVWGGQPMHVRVTQLEATVSRFEWFDVSNADHLHAVDGRLNQSFLAGLAVSRLSDIGGFAHGKTVWEALLALVPRAIWPDKPVQAGSGSLVSEYTGLRFVAGTSVGIGNVMEFYVNFGTIGVLLGFVLMGVLLTTLDLAAAKRLAVHDLHGFVLWFLPGISLLQVGGSLVEATGSAAASVFVALVANAYLHRVRGRQMRGRQWPSPRALQSHA
jgi:hypothetical protein